MDRGARRSGRLRSFNCPMILGQTAGFLTRVFLVILPSVPSEEIVQ